MKKYLFTTLALFFFSIVWSQNFVNGDLNGIIMGASSLPNGWSSVPFTDPNCNATSAFQATPDLTSLTAPSPAGGLNGNPYSGTTFISGVHGITPFITYYFHEGIKQLVTGLNVGCSYNVNFYQTVVKANASLDTSGSWSVYFDNILIGVTNPTVSHEIYNSNKLPWEFRSLPFVANATSHVIKFLPTDDDSNLMSSETDEGGALRMGIDSIYLTNVSTLNSNDILGNDTVLCDEESILLNAYTLNCSYLWQDLSTKSTFEATQPGYYSVEISDGCLTIKDVIFIQYTDCDCQVFIPNAFTPNGDNNNDKIAPIFSCANPEFEFSIYNRLGQQIFFTTLQNDFWDGTYLQQIAPIGSYFYLLKYQYQHQDKKIIKGDITLIR